MTKRTSLTRRAPRVATALSAAIAFLVAACEPGPVDDADLGAAAPGPDETPGLAMPPPAPPEVPEARIAANVPDDAATAVTGAAAVAQLEPTEGNTTAGTAEFVVEDDGSMTVHTRLTGLPAGTHGIHIHEFGDCSAPDASSAGDHFAPDDDPHGSPYDVEHHAGDLGNITADESGAAEKMLDDDQLSLVGDFGLVGRAIVVHSGEDDLTTQPAGSSGTPLACGVIRAAESGPATPPPA